MSSYFRCGNTDDDCPLARTREALPAKDWEEHIRESPNCEILGEPVSFFEVHKKKILGGGGVALLLLLVLVIGNLLKPDPFSSKLLELVNTNSALHGRLSSVEGKAGSRAKPANPVENLVRIADRAEESYSKVTGALEKDLPDVAKKELTVLEGLPEQAESVRQAARNPARSSGSVAVEAAELKGKFQDLIDDAKELQFQAELDQRTDVVSETELVMETARDGLVRLNPIVSPPKVEIDEGRMKDLIDQIEGIYNKGKSAFAGYQPAPKAPFLSDEAEFRIATSSDLSSNLVAPLLSAFLSTPAISPGDDCHYFEGGKHTEKAVILSSPTISHGNLVAGACDLIITSAKPSSSDEAAFQNAFPGASLKSRAQTEVIALDALTFVTHPDSSRELVKGDEVYSLQWVAGNEESASFLAAKRLGLSPIAGGTQAPSIAALSKRDFLGSGVYHQEGENLRAKRLAYQASDAARAIEPSPYSIATEDYRFSFRISASHSPKSNALAQQFVSFVTSEQGQNIVKNQGYVDLRLRPTGESAPPLVLSTLGSALGQQVDRAYRISTNLRFATGESYLDIKALADLERLPRFIADKYPDGSVVILGFTDSTGGPTVNVPLSVDRAEEIASELRKSGMSIVTAGLGEQLPVDTNDTEEGKSRNRRAEVWVVP